ncbi:MAG: hypothetical protein HQK69_00975, partial [Desulfamplus sp.]|nr:hypothetical protein [Desulfamplus sp.]
MKTDFFTILQQTSELLSWYKEIGIQNLDLSEESLNSISRWCNKNSTQYTNIKSNSSPISCQHPVKNLTQHNTHSNQNSTHLTEHHTNLKKVGSTAAKAHNVVDGLSSFFNPIASSIL